jgi:hypothetical protein
LVSNSDRAWSIEVSSTAPRIELPALLTNASIRPALSQIRSLIERVSGTFFPALQTNARAEAIVTMCTLVGALLVARAVDDPALSAEILAANRAHFGVTPEVGE